MRLSSVPSIKGGRIESEDLVAAAQSVKNEVLYRSGRVLTERLIHEAGRRLGVNVLLLADEVIFVTGANAPFFAVLYDRRMLAINGKAVYGTDET